MGEVQPQKHHALLQQKELWPSLLAKERASVIIVEGRGRKEGVTNHCWGARSRLPVVLPKDGKSHGHGRRFPVIAPGVSGTALLTGSDLESPELRTEARWQGRRRASLSQLASPSLHVRFFPLMSCFVTALTTLHTPRITPQASRPGRSW